MTESELNKKVFEVFDILRGQRHNNWPIDLLNELKNRNIHIPIEQIPELTTMLANYGGQQTGYLATPKMIISFIEALLKGNKINTLLDPWAGIGSLISVVEHLTNAEKGSGPQVKDNFLLN